VSGGRHIPDGKCEHLPEPECLFYRSVQGKDSGKNQALTILDASERNEVWWANFPKANEA
jgi:hypothetical protein